MEQLIDSLRTAADAMATVDRSVPALVASAGAFAADDVGVPGRMGHQLHDRWVAVLTARAEEAAATATRLNDLAAAVRETERHYAETDSSVSHHIERMT